MGVCEVPEQRLDFYWDERRNGSPEHYWHFMFGYLLPLIAALRCRAERSPPACVGLFDCGPLMNRLLVEALSRLGVELQFDASLFAENGRMQLGEDAVLLDRWDLLLTGSGDRGALKASLIEAREAAAAALARMPCCVSGRAQGKYLLLRRSPEPSFYQSDGEARIKTYGAGRRMLLGIEDARRELEAQGVQGLVYEPGLHNLACQIAHFSSCSGAVGVRGAEFANMIWMSIPAKVFVFMSSSASHPPPLRALASLLGLAYREIDHGGEANPTLDVARIIDHIRDPQGAQSW